MSVKSYVSTDTAIEVDRFLILIHNDSYFYRLLLHFLLFVLQIYSNISACYKTAEL